jgi:hypothetical protein
MSTDRWSAFLSILAAIAVVGASYIQWWDVTTDGDLRTRKWVKLILFPGVLVLLVVAAGLLVFGE